MITPQIIRNEIAKIIKEKRCIKGISQEQLAKMLGVSRQSINYCEKAKTSMRFSTFWKMIEVGFITCEEIDNRMEGLNAKSS